MILRPERRSDINNQKREVNMTANEAKGPLFRNRTDIDQVVYDESYSPILIPSTKTIRGEWYRKYAGKQGPLVLVGKDRGKEDVDEEEQNTAGDKSKD